MAAPRKAAGSGILVARQSFTAELDGVPVSVVRGVTHVREGHPLLEGREELFEPVTVHFEVNSAAPAGETRG